MATFAKRSRARWRDLNTVVERRFHAREYIEAYVPAYARIKMRY